MKPKLLKLTVVLFLGLLAFTSCNKEEDVVADPPIEKSGLQDLSARLNLLSTNTLVNYGINPILLTKGGEGNLFDVSGNNFDQIENERKMRWWKRLLAVFAADAMGGAVGTAAAGPAGGAILGIFASLEMFKETGRLSVTTEENFSQYQILMDSICYNMNNYVSDIDVIGDCHNDVIRLILKDKNYYLDENGDFKQDLVIETIKNEVKKYGLNIDVPSDLIKTNLAKIADARKDYKIEDFDGQMVGYSSLFTEKETANIIKEYIVTAASLPNVQAIKNYSYDFEREVFGGAIPEFDRNVLISGESIGKNSIVGWRLDYDE